MTRSAIKETLYKRANKPAVLLVNDVDRAWLAACAIYREQLVADLIPKDRDGRFMPGPQRGEFEGVEAA